MVAGLIRSGMGVFAGRLFFRDLDKDGDGRVSMEDMKSAMRARKLPEAYAHEFIKRARGGKWWSRSIGWATSLFWNAERGWSNLACALLGQGCASIGFDHVFGIWILGLGIVDTVLDRRKCGQELCLQ